jgi:hypothetical protein
MRITQARSIDHMKKHLPAKPAADSQHGSVDTLVVSRVRQRRTAEASPRGAMTSLTHGDVARYAFSLLFAVAALGVILFGDGRNENWAYTTLGALVTAFVTRRAP